MSLLQMSFAGAVMILAITIIRALAISLLPKKTFLALWGIAVARLLLPFSLPSMFSVYSLIGNQTFRISATKVPQLDKVLPINTIGQMAATPGDIGSTTSAVSIWGTVWAAGTLICAMVFAAAYWKCRKEFQASLPVENDFIKNWLDTHQQKRPIAVRQSARFSAPLTYGVFCPVILMPMSTNWKNTKTLQYVLAHEYVHIRRFDSVAKLVLIAALCVHWFNPLVWVMYILANRDIELSCDEAVVRLFGETTKAAYARALISMEETRSGLTPLCSNFSRSAIEERITAIMKYRKTSIISLALALALIFGITVAFATSTSSNHEAKAEYPVNENGQTYGSATLAKGYDERPDLIAAIGRDGQAGYVYKTDLEAGNPKTPAEALAQQQQYEAMAMTSVGKQIVVRSIPLYAVDGKTDIGMYDISFFAASAT